MAKNNDFDPRITIVEVDIGKLHCNVKIIRNFIPKNVKFMAVVKANAYGHGIEKIALELTKNKVDYLAVACLGEVMRIREGGVKLPILNLGPTILQEAEAIIKYDYAPTVYDLGLVKKLSQVAKRENKRIKIHIKVDTGMGRIGVLPEDVLSFVEEVQKLPNIEIEGIYTHFACADEPLREPTILQNSRFKKVIDELKKNNINIPLIHAANSAATLWYPETYYSMIRPGSLIYGLNPNFEMKMPIKLEPILTLKTYITHIKTVPPCSAIGYAWTYYTRYAATKIASIPIGYADGLRRSPKNQKEVLVGGKRVPIIGLICMDQMMLDVTSVKDVKLYDEVVVLGGQGKELITADEIGTRTETIYTEVLSALAHRITRKYIYTTF